jgi:hypothetical protein
MPILRRVRSMHPKTVHGGGMYVWDVAVPYEVRVLGQRDALHLLVAERIEQANLHFRGICREQVKVRAFTVPNSPMRLRAAFANAGFDYCIHVNAQFIR